MKRMDRFVKFITDKELANSEMGTLIKVNSSMVFYTVKELSVGLMAPSTRGSSEVMRSLELVDINGLIPLLLKETSKMVLDTVKVNTSTPKRVLNIKENGLTE
jgi:hypothetical protein